MLPARILLAAALLGLAAPALPAHADDQRAVDALNLPMTVVQEKSKSWKGLCDACAAMTAPPLPVGKDFNQLTIWPGMANWDKVKEWAAANGRMTKALIDAQPLIAFGMPYGRASVPPTYVEKGLFIGIGDGLTVFVSNPAYLKPFEAVLAYSTAEMYRLGEEKKFAEAFELGVATLRFLRQVADQQLLEEKRWALGNMSDYCSVQRDFMQTYLDVIPVALFKKVGMTGYPYIRAADGERLRRLEMPEGDRILAELMMMQLFDAKGQPDAVKFAATMGDLQTRNEPLTRFGAAKRWSEIAVIPHGSLDASRNRLTGIYDDWWRRWRVRYYDALLDNPTLISRTNKVRYAMVLLMAKDLESVFALRQRLNAELNGTAMAASLCAAFRELGAWPRALAQTYTQFTVKRMDYDPWDPAYGRWQYARLDSPRAIECEYGRLQISGCVLFARGVDKEDGGAAKATTDGVSGDFVAWPALRALGRAQGSSGKPGGETPPER